MKTGEMNVSTSARVKLESIVEGNDTPFRAKEAVPILVGALDIQPETAENYVRNHCELTKINGERHIVNMKERNDNSERSTISTTNENTDEAPAKTVSDTSTNEGVASSNRPAGPRTGDDFEGLPVLQDEGRPSVPNVNHSYLRREQQGNTTDIENICEFLNDPDFSLLLVGETGTGKDYSILYVGARTNRGVRRVNFGQGTTYEDLVGLYAPKPDAEQETVRKVRELTEAHEDLSMSDAISLVNGAKSHFDYQLGVLSECAINGDIFVGDEINAAGGEATMPLHGLTESEGSRYIHLKPSSKVLTDLPVTDAEVEEAARKHNVSLDDDYSQAAHLARVDKWDNDVHYGEYIHPEFTFVGTMNPPTYAGTKPLNDAFRTRFWVVNMDYLPKKAEKRLMMETTPFDSDNPEDVRAVDSITDILQNLRQSYKDMDIVTPISHREALKIGKLSQRMGPKDATKFVLTNIAQDEDKSAITDAINMKKF